MIKESLKNLRTLLEIPAVIKDIDECSIAELRNTPTDKKGNQFLLLY
jgi:hypothetical protein